MKPVSDFTTPLRLICPISRHFFPAEQPDPVGCCTTGLKKGSRFPVIAHFLSSGLGALAASALLPAGGALAVEAIFVGPATGGVAGAFGAASLAAITGCDGAVCDAAGFEATGTACGFAAVATGAGVLCPAGTAGCDFATAGFTVAGFAETG